MPRPVDDLRAQLAAEDPDFVAALLDDRVTVARLGGHGRGLRYRKGGQMVEVFGLDITHLPDGTEVDTDLTDAATEDTTITPHGGKLFRNGGYTMAVDGVSLTYGAPEVEHQPGVYRPCVLTRRARQGDTTIWDNEWGGGYSVRVRSTGVETRWSFAVRPPALRTRFVVTGSVVSPDGTIPLPGGESLTIQPAKWRDSHLDAVTGTLSPQVGSVPFSTVNGYIPLVLPSPLDFPVIVDG